MTTTTSAEAGARNRTLSRAVIAGGSAMALGGMSLAVGAAPAEATHDHDHISGYLNSTSWRVCQDDTPSFGSIIGVNWAVALYDSHNDLVVQRSEGTGAGCNPTPNLHVVDANFPEALDNITLCFNWEDANAGLCRIKLAVLNMDRLNAAPNPASQWKKASCQAFGRVAGLGDRFTTASCMTEGGAPPIALTPDQHDMDAIAATY